MGMARANLTGKGVVAPISCSCAFGSLLLAAKPFFAAWLLADLDPIVSNAARPTHCHPKTNNSARV